LRTCQSKAETVATRKASQNAIEAFWDYFSFSKSSDGQVVQPEPLGPGAMNTPPATEKKQ